MIGCEFSNFGLLDPAIYVFRALVILAAKTWIPGTSPGKRYL
jgi:hypothetical protein